MLSTDKQTNRRTNATKNITSFAKEVIIDLFDENRTDAEGVAYMSYNKWIFHIKELLKKCLDILALIIHNLIKLYGIVLILRPSRI